MLDLGCGDGALLAHLRDHRQVRGAGVELDDTCVISCVRRGVEVIQQNLEDGLALFDDKQFDTVVLSQTCSPCTAPSTSCAKWRGWPGTAWSRFPTSATGRTAGPSCAAACR